MYDTIIVGAGISGAFTANFLDNNFLILEKGKDLFKRREAISGWFGRALYSMSRLQLSDPLLNNKKMTKKALDLLKINPTQQFQEFSPNFGQELALYLFNKLHNKTKFNTEVIDITNENYITIKTNKETYKTKNCVIATGKYSFQFIQSISNSLNIKLNELTPAVGVRIELLNKLAKNLDRTQNICQNNVKIDDIIKNSFIAEWEENKILSAYGCSVSNQGQTSLMFNFIPNIPVDDVIRNVRIVNVLSNDKIRKEKVKDFMENSSVLEHISLFNPLKTSFEEFNDLFPNFINSSIMYSPEIKFNGLLPVNAKMKTTSNNIFAVGECTNKVSNLIGAVSSALIASNYLGGKL